jgi:hypothetical protein
MAQVQISQLPQAGAITGTELVPVVQNGVTVKTTTGAISASPSQTQTFITLNQEPSLPNSRRLSGGTGIGLVDSGAQSTLQITLNATSGSLETAGIGLSAKTGGASVTARTLTASGAGIAVTDGNGVAGNPTVALTGLPLALANTGGTGFLAVVGGTVIAGRQFYGTTNQIDIADGNGSNSPVISLASNPILPGTGSMTVPIGTGAQQPVGSNGQIRFNSDTQTFDGYQDGSWRTFALTGGVSSFSAGSTGFSPVAPTVGAVTLSGTLNVSNGGTGSTNASDARTSLDVPSRSGVGATGTWAIDISGNSGTAISIAGGTSNQILYQSNPGTTSFISAPSIANTFLEWSGSAFQWSANPLGTVTSVGLSLPSEFSISGSPVTTSGTLTGSWANQTANYIFAAPNGSSGVPSFRAMVAADVPTLNQNTTGQAGSVANSVTFNSTGGAAANTSFNGSAPVTVDYSTIGAPKTDGTGATGTWGINISGNAATATSATSATSATTATNLAGGAAGSIPYQTGAGATSMLAAGSGVLIGGSTPSYSTSPSLTGTNFSSIPNGALQNSSITLGTTGVSLGATSLTLGGLTSVEVTQNPLTALQLATKQYVDTLVSSGITYHAPVKYEVPNTTGNLNAIYNNGTAGVGATLTNNGTLAAFAPDGPTASPGDRILIYNQTNAFENGVYTVTTVGDGSTAWVLTRATDADTYALKSPNGLGEGDAFFIQSGNTGAGETYLCNTVGTITFGTTAITFTQISASQVYSAGTGLTLTGTQFSLTSPVVTSNGGTGLTSYTAGDMVYYATGTALSKLAIGASTYVMTSTGSAPQWSAPSGLTVGSATNVAGGGLNQIAYQTGIGATGFIAAPTVANTFLEWSGSAFQWSVNPLGTVTSIDVSGGTTGLTFTGGPVTTSGTITMSGTLAIANGGTNATATPTAGAVAYGTGTAYAFTSAGSSGQVLISGGAGAPTWKTATSANTASTIVERDSSGDFSAGTITANLNGTASTATNAVNIGITDDTSTNATMYPVWVTANTGNLPAKVTSTKLSFNPSTGVLTSTGGITGGTF